MLQRQIETINYQIDILKHTLERTHARTHNNMHMLVIYQIGVHSVHIKRIHLHLQKYFEFNKFLTFPIWLFFITASSSLFPMKTVLMGVFFNLVNKHVKIGNAFIFSFFFHNNQTSCTN